MHKNKLTMIRIWFEQKLRKETTMNSSKKSAILNILVQQANEIIDDDMVVIDDHSGCMRKVDHLVILEAGNALYLCPVIDSAACCLNSVEKEDDGYHLTKWSVGGTVKPRTGSIFEVADEYNKNQDACWTHAPECASHIIKVVA